MYWLATRNAVVSFPRWRSLSLLLRSPAHAYTSFRPSPTLLYSCRQLEQIYCFKGQKVFKESSKPTKKLKASSDTLNDKDLLHLLWWKEICRKPSTVQLIKRLTYSNLLGLDVNLKNGRHAHPGSPYVFGLVGVNHDLDFPEPMPVVATCKLMSNVTCSIPEFTCVSSAKLVKLLEQREANHIEFCRIKNLLDGILHMYKNSELNEILKLLMDPTWVATGLKIDFETLISINT